MPVQKRTKALAIAILAGLAIIICGCGVKPTGEATEIQSIDVHADCRFKLVVECDSEHGSAWKLSKHLDVDKVLFVESETVDAPEPGEPSAGYSVWTFMAQNPGHTQIVLESTKMTHVFDLNVSE